MAHYDVTYSCGCTGTVQLFGPHVDRERKLQWLATQQCPKCARAAREDKRKDEAVQIAEYERANNLMSLNNGKYTDKQVAYASAIRYWMSRCIDKLETRSTSPAAKEIVATWRGSLYDKDARFYLDICDKDAYKDASYDCSAYPTQQDEDGCLKSALSKLKLDLA